MQANPPNAQPAVPAPAQSQRSIFNFKFFMVIGLAWMIANNIYSHFKPKDPSYVHFSNAISPAANFTLKVLLHDLNTKVVKELFVQTGFEYSLNETKSTTRFNITLPTKDLQARHDRYRVEALVYFKGNDTQTSQVVNCFSEITQMLESKFSADDTAQGVPGRKTGITEPHIFSKLYFQMVYDENTYDFTEDPLVNYLYKKKAVPRNPSNPKSPTTDFYNPHLDCSQYWVLRRDKVKLSQFVEKEEVPIEVEFSTAWIQKFLWTFKFRIAEMQTDSLLHDSSAFEEFKTILTDNSFTYLVILFSVNFLHTLFSFLSIKNNISFWNNLKSTEGISVRKYYTDIFFQIVVILYLIDNEASFIVTALTVIEGLVSLWIALKMIRFEKRDDGKFPYYRLPTHRSQVEDETAVYDKKATRFMTILLLPCLIGYTIYSFYTKEHLSLYSFTLKTLVSFIYAIGFINMTPQIYINYKLKSVEHLPWKGMVYQFLNTIIDDLFAFAVKMPTLQRLSVFRDDVIFVIYLVQKYIYRKNKRPESADKTQSESEDKKDKKDKKDDKNVKTEEDAKDDKNNKTEKNEKGDKNEKNKKDKKHKKEENKVKDETNEKDEKDNQSEKTTASIPKNKPKRE